MAYASVELKVKDQELIIVDIKNAEELGNTMNYIQGNIIKNPGHVLYVNFIAGDACTCQDKIKFFNDFFKLNDPKLKY